MKHIHIVEPYHSSSMEAMSRPLVDALAKIYRVTIATVPDPNADLNYHIPWHTLAGLEKGSGKHAMLYTHCNPDMQARLLDACKRADLIICMSFTGRRELIKRGVDPAKMWVITPSIRDGIKTRQRNIGVFGNEQPNGRKRSHILLELAWRMDCSPFHFIISGSGWDDVVTKMRNTGAAVDLIESTDEVAIYPLLDAFLVTGFIEGGPLPVLEALAAGVPVLSPRCGLAADLLSDDCFYEDAADLVEKLQKLERPFSDRSKLSRMHTWENYVNEHALVFGRLLGESVELDPRNGAGRYAQLLDIISERKPELIVEIGTWNGANAVRMIQEASKYGDVDYSGYDLFESMTADQLRSEFSKWGWPREIVEERLGVTDAVCRLWMGDTKETLEDQLYAATALYFIDGGHSEQTIASDWSHISFSVRLGCVAVFDDYYHANKPRGMGCNAIIDGLDRALFNVEHLPARTLNDDGLEIGMVKVTHANLPVC